MNDRSGRLCPLLAFLLVSVFAYGQGTARETGEIVQYLKTGNLVYGAVVRDSEGIEVRRETYIRDSAGDIAQIVLRWADGRVERLGVSGDREWIVDPDGTGLYRVYNSDGTLKKEEYRDGDRILRRVTYQYPSGSSRASSVLDENVRDGTEERKDYGEDGLLIRELRIAADGAEETVSYAYDAEKRVIEIRTATNRKETRTRFMYGEDGTETEERFDSTGALVVRRIRRADDEIVEEQYDAGGLFARVYYKEGRKVREEILEDGNIKRVREAP